MQTINKLLTAILLAGLTTATIAAENKVVKVMADDDNGVVTKTITVNGKQLNAEKIAAMQASGELDIVNADGRHGKNVMFIKSGNDNVSGEDIDISVSVDGDTVTKKIIMNGKQLTVDEIAELETSGKLKTIHIDTNGDSPMHKVMFFNTDEIGADGNHEIRVETKLIHTDEHHATLGFMTNVKNDGWHVISVIEGSGAEEAGLKAGDIVKFMGDKDLTQEPKDLANTLNIIKHKAGDMVDLEVLRDEELIYMSVEARKNDSLDIIVNIDTDEIGETTRKFKLISIDEFEKLDSPNIAKNSFLHLSGKMLDFDDMEINLPDMLGNMNIFITDGSSTSKLLGKNHEMSTLSEGLASYFGTKGGVLMMNVATDNAFGLEDGDVIKSINGNHVTTPKQVIKQLLKAQQQEKIKIKIVRHKQNKTLKYKK